MLPPLVGIDELLYKPKTSENGENSYFSFLQLPLIESKSL